MKYSRTILQAISKSSVRKMSDCKESKPILRNIEDVFDIMSKRDLTAAYLFIGNGAKLQYKNMDEVKERLSPVLDRLQANHGVSKWLAVYGGDTFVKEKPDLGAVMAFVKEKYNPPLVSVQGWPEYDNFVDYVLMYDPETTKEGRIVYGGVKDGKLFGGTKVYLCTKFQKVLKGVVNLDAQGRIGKAEIEYAREVGLNVIDVEPLTPKNCY